MTGEASAHRGDELRERLTYMREEIVLRMIRRGAVEPSHLPFVAGINATLDALDLVPIEADPAARAVVSDDGRDTRLTLHSTSGAIASVELDAVRAVALAIKLLVAVLPRLPQI